MTYPVVTSIMESLRVRLPGALDGAIMLEMFNVVDEMCRTAHIYHYSHPLPLTAGGVAYTVVIPDLEIVQFDALDHNELRSSAVIYDDTEHRLTIDPAPDAAAAAVAAYLDVVVAPKHGVTDPDKWLPEAVWVHAAQTVIDGVLLRMMSQPAKPYSSEKIALYHGRRFRSGMARLRHQTNIQRTPDGQRWAFPAFARGRR